MRIKVCGMTKPEQVKQLDEMGVRVCRLYFYPKSPRYVFRNMPSEEIKRFAARLTRWAFCKYRPRRNSENG